MKQIKILKLLGYIIIFSLLTISCEKTHLIDESVHTPADEYIDNKDYCGNTLTFPLTRYYNQQDYGFITIGNDESTLIFNYDIDNSNGYYIQETAIFVINDGITPPLGPWSGGYIADAWNPEGTGHFFTFNFPFITSGLNTMVHQEMIAFSELENEGINLNECLDIVAGVLIYESATGYTYWVFAKPTLKSIGWYVDFCIEPCEEPTCETAYAYGEDPDDCFLNLNTQGNNWGWSNGGITYGEYQWDIYAGAGQCDISKGTLVGTLDIVYSGGVAAITYNIDAGYNLEETHLHIGESEKTRLPLNKKKKFITAPGKFDYSGGSYFEIENLEGPIWVTAHAVVCGDFE